jgi:hypothetical protein
VGGGSFAARRVDYSVEGIAWRDSRSTARTRAVKRGRWLLRPHRVVRGGEPFDAPHRPEVGSRSEAGRLSAQRLRLCFAAMKLLVSILPTLLAFGPLFMVMGSGPSLPWVGYVGAFMTSTGLLVLMALAGERRTQG